MKLENLKWSFSKYFQWKLRNWCEKICPSRYSGLVKFCVNFGEAISYVCNVWIHSNFAFNGNDTSNLLF